MKKKHAQSDFKWPFAKRRQQWIEEADRLQAEADEAIDDYEFNPDTKKRATAAKKAAARFEHAAEYYRRAGLGLAARRCFFEASACWSDGDCRDAAEVAESIADEIDFHYGDEEDYIDADSE